MNGYKQQTPRGGNQSPAAHTVAKFSAGYATVIGTLLLLLLLIVLWLVQSGALQQQPDPTHGMRWRYLITHHR